MATVVRCLLLRVRQRNIKPMNPLYVSFCKLLFQLSRLLLPIEPIIYDTKFKPGEVTDYYERYLVTRELAGYRLWHVSFCILEPLSVKKHELFDHKLTAVLAARAKSDYAICAIEMLLSRKNVPAIFGRLELNLKAKAVAETDDLDEFVEVDCCWPGWVEYKTTHGIRILNVEEPEQCQFEVTKNGGDFAKALLLPYMVYRYSDEYPDGTLVVYADTWDEDARAAGYASAVPLSVPLETPLYIEHLDMLDTEYVALITRFTSSSPGEGF